MRKIVKNFNFETFFFHNNSLIEASAGTGKTHTIIILYLRLLLGINDNCSTKLTVENILIVTFTKKAVEELRERIKNIIHEFRYVCIVGYSQNLLFSTILDKISDLSLAYNQLLRAEQTINKAQIFTIHSFCQHILNMYPIELNIPFQYTILEDENNFLQKACNDFWRRYFYPLPVEIISIIEEYWKSPRDLLLEIYPYLYNREIIFQPLLKGDIVTQHKDIISYIMYVKSIWNKEQEILFNFVNHASLNRRVYNKRNITNWFTNVNLWAKNLIVKDYKVPKELKYFKYTVIFNNINCQKNEIWSCISFKIIEVLFQKIKSLKQLILNMAIKKVREFVECEKNFSSKISFNDLIFLLDTALRNSGKEGKLAQLIRIKYPVAIIDEFQDTDFQQYRIFRTLYPKSQEKYKLLLIGDPKQSIYSFRGADIFSYLSARKDINFQYSLNINWRASHNMVNAINALFQFNSKLYPFVFKDIPFIPLQSAKNRKHFHLVIKNKLSPPLCFWLPTNNKLSLNEYRKIMADQCACMIYDLLHGSNCGSVWLQNEKNKKRLLKASDIVILVRDHNEEYLISSVLKTLNIATMCCSNQKHIFKTNESIELVSILQAILNPEDDNILRYALITKIIGYDAKKIDFINQNVGAWKEERKEFVHYYFFWEKYGVYPMLQEILFRRSFPKKVLSTIEDEQYLINILHLGEILQEKSLELNNKNLLISWLSTQISNSCDIDRFNKQLLRLNNNDQFIKIITIHKAKGLEFPLVFLPFVSPCYKTKYALFHNRENYQLCLDFNNSLQNSIFSREEQLSEYLRIFYVAITRAVYYCFIGIGAVYFTKSNKKHTSDLHHTALGYLIQGGVPGDVNFLQECLNKLITYSNGDITYNVVSTNTLRTNKSFISNKIAMMKDNNICKKIFFAKDWKVSINNVYKVTSYTELHHYNKHPIILLPNVKLEAVIKEKYKRNKITNHNILLTPHTFPRGNMSGDLLHLIFQNWNFQSSIDHEWLTMQLNRKNIDLIWLPMLESWTRAIVSTPLNKEGFMLSKLSSANYYSELPFYLSVDNSVSSKLFDDICRYYDPIFRLSPTLKFPDIFGMLRGFIDLIFFWKGKYYLLDYKSTWLGDRYDDYTISNIENAMIVHQYTLQYQIYTLALHRFLRYKVVDYDYEKDFGGVYYLFLRGIDIMYPHCGVYFCRPDQLLIKKLDQLLSSSSTIDR